MCEGLFYPSLPCKRQPWAIKNPQCSCWGWLWTGIFFLCLHHQMSEACARSFSIWKGKAKCLHLTNWPVKGTLWRVFICLRPRTLYPPSHLHTVCVYEYIQGHREGGRVKPELRRRGEGQQFTKLGQKYQRGWQYTCPAHCPVYKLL